jgi:hypothetical protein
VTTREPEWTDQDRAEVLALAVHRGQLCPGGCGQLLADGTSHYETGPEFVVTSTVCRACVERDMEIQIKADRKDPYAGARLWQITKRKAVGDGEPDSLDQADG